MINSVSFMGGKLPVYKLDKEIVKRIAEDAKYTSPYEPVGKVVEKVTETFPKEAAEAIKLTRSPIKINNAQGTIPDTVLESYLASIGKVQ